MAETIEPVSLRVETEERYLNYAMSVITSRALPDVRDGLKPVQRRILYTMYHDLHLTFDGRPRKCAKIIGDVTGNYHPHGEAAAYEALVRMAQNFVMRAPLVHGQGNFGSVDGDPPAADRYTEAKLAAVSESLLVELRQRTVTMRPNYDNTREEPVVLPAQFPNLLVNGASGIAVGMATNIPPHNLGEVVQGAAFSSSRTRRRPRPSFWTRSRDRTFRWAARSSPIGPRCARSTRTGPAASRSRASGRSRRSGKRQQIVVTSIPYGVDKGKLEVGHRRDHRLAQAAATAQPRQRVQRKGRPAHRPGDEAGHRSEPGDGVPVQAHGLAGQLRLQPDMPGAGGGRGGQGADAAGTARPQGDPATTSSISGLATVRRRFEYELEQLRRRIHILEGFRIIFNALDKAIKLIRDSEGKADAAERLISTFKLDEEQAEAILDAQLYKIAQTGDQEDPRRAEGEDGAGREDRGHPAFGEEALGRHQGRAERAGREVRRKDRRRTRMGSSEDAPEFDPEAYIVRENTNVVLTRDGWIKRVGRLASVEGTRSPRRRRGDRRRARQHARSRHLLRRRRHGLHDAYQRGPGILGLRRADRQVLPPGRSGAYRRRRDDGRAFHAGRPSAQPTASRPGPICSW